MCKWASDTQSVDDIALLLTHIGTGADKITFGILKIMANSGSRASSAVFTA